MNAVELTDAASGCESPRAGARRPAWASTTILPLALFIMLAVGLDIFFFTGFAAISDDNSYFLAAHRIVHGQPLIQAGDIPDEALAYRRLGVTLPLALVYLLAKGRIFWCSFSFIGWHLAAILLAYNLGKTIHERRVGLIAAALVACAPVYYIFAGLVLPDIPLAVWDCSTLLLLLHLRKRAGQAPLGDVQSAVLPLAAGVTAGVACLTKISGLLIVPVALALCLLAAPRLFSKRSLMNCAWLAMGLVLVLIAERLSLAALGSSWTNPVAFLSNFSAYYDYKVAIQGALPHERAAYLWSALDKVMPLSRWFLLAGLLVYPFLKNRDLMVWLICLWLLAYQTVGSSSLAKYLPPTLLERYYAVVILLAALFMGHALITATHYLKRRLKNSDGLAARATLALPLVLCAFMATGDLSRNAVLAGDYGRNGLVHSFVESYHATQDMLPGTPIVLSHSLSDRMLAMFLSLPEKTVLRNRLYNRHFDMPLPPPPFVFLEETEVIDKRKTLLDFDPPAEWGKVSIKLINTIWTGPARYQELLTGNWLAGLNPNLVFRERERGTAIVLVSKAQP